MNLYVIGPVTGKPNENREEFERVRGELLDNATLGAVSIPHDYIEPDSTWKHAMHMSITVMMQLWSFELGPVIHQPFGIAMLDGWEGSKGATIEHDLACALGIECRPWREWL